MSKEITTKQEFMNVKQIAELIGCSGETVKRKIREFYPSAITNGKETLLTPFEALTIVGELKAEVKRQIRPTQPTQNVQVVSQAEMFLKQAEINVQYEKKMIEMENRLTEVEKQNEKKKEIVKLLPEVKPTTMRKDLNRIIRSMGEKIGYQVAWKNLYTEYYYRYEINITTRCKHYNQKNNSKLNVLDYAEQFEHLEHLLSLAIELFTSEV